MKKKPQPTHQFQHEENKSSLYCAVGRCLSKWAFCFLLFFSWVPVEAKDTFRIAVFQVPPLITQNTTGVIEGFNIDLLEEVARKEGWNLEFVNGSWSEGLERLKAGKVDILTSVAYTKERDAFMDYGQEPILTTWSEVYVQQGSGIQSFFDLSNKRVAIMTSDFNARVFHEHMVGFKVECEYVEMPDFNAVFHAIEKNQVDAGVVNNTFGAARSSAFSVKATDIVFNPFPIHFTVAKGKNRVAIDTLDSYLVAWKKDHNSFYYKALKDWMRRDVGVNHVVPSWLWKTIAVLGALFLVVVLFSVILRSQVKRALSQLRVSEERYRILFERAGDAIFLVDMRTGQYLSANKAAELLTGRSLAELQQLTTHELTPEGAKERLSSIIDSDQRQDLGETIYLRPDGQQRTALLETIPLNESICFGIARDITEQKKAKEEWEKLQMQLIQAQKMEAIGTLAGGIAHDFNNILGAIIGYAELAKDDCIPGSTIEKDLGKVLESGNRAKNLVTQILAFSRHADIEFRYIQPANIVNEAINMLRPSLPATIEIIENIDPVTGHIFADPSQFSQIVMNLCTNAFHAMEKTGGRLSISLKETTLNYEDLTCEQSITPGAFIQLSICDSGPGMTQEVKDKIFEPYFTTKETGKGTGMGLSIVHGIVKDHGGFMILDSELGKGTYFQIFFPVLEENALYGTEVVKKNPAGKERVLFIDDEEILADMGKNMLERFGYHVTVRKNSIEALETFQEQPDEFDVVITDQTMPGMTGTDLARRMLQIRPDIPIILCTGYSSTTSEEQAKSMGIKEFAMKPLAKEDIGILIRKVLDTK